MEFSCSPVFVTCTFPRSLQLSNKHSKNTTCLIRTTQVTGTPFTLIITIWLCWVRTLPTNQRKSSNRVNKQEKTLVRFIYSSWIQVEGILTKEINGGGEFWEDPFRYSSWLHICSRLAQVLEILESSKIWFGHTIRIQTSYRQSIHLTRDWV